MEDLKKLLQNLWENTAFQSKIFFKSHDVTLIIQFSLLIIPSILWIISLSLYDGSSTYWLDLAASILSIFALAYFIYFGKNQEIYKERWEKYMKLYHDIEFYYKWNKWKYNISQIEKFKEKIAELNLEKKIPCHSLIKWLVDWKIDKEMTYWNEKTPRYKE